MADPSKFIVIILNEHCLWAQSNPRYQFWIYEKTLNRWGGAIFVLSLCVGNEKVENANER